MASVSPTSLSNVREATSFIFGGHIGPQTKNSLEKQVRQIVDGDNGKWILETLAGLPRYWQALTQEIPELASTMDGARLLADLESWFRHGADSVVTLAPDTEIPDLWIGVLMVSIQLDQYWRYLQFRFNSLTVIDAKDLQALLLKKQQEQPPGGSNKVETVGFCAGMIAAVAVASSHNRQEFEKYGATALRIGALMAALVGATEASTKGLGKGGSVSLATAWRTPKQSQDMVRIVSKLSPDAYISVLFDESRATVTASERLVPKLVRQLRAAGITAIPLAFKGQLHTPTAERQRQTEALIKVCHSLPELQFPDAAKLALPTYLDHPEGKQISGEEVDLVGMVLRSILAHQLNWTSTVSKLVTNKEDISLIAFGLDRPLPPTILRAFGSKQVHFEDVEDEINKFRVPLRQQPQSNDNNTVNGPGVVELAQATQQSAPSVKPEEDSEDVIAIVGMSLKVAGGQDLEEFEQMLKTGESQHEVITRERMTSDMLFRDNPDPDRKWYGNFMRDADAFDHKFFKKSPREAMAIDPQGRLSLEAAYNSIAQSGYFNELATTSTAEHERRKHVGVYVGLCSYEYDVNIHCHPTSAFTGTGELRSFIPGRVSHYFGWTGPSLTFDTACSSSTTALHMACRDLLSGEVPAALCGGVNVLTNLQWTQNLAAGSFISPTGQCKPFDSNADGYCRGDGIAYVFLKKLSTAVADGNTILGTVRATGINQNLNTTPLFVPNVPSLSTLFNDVIRKARVDPRDISLVECHGTGTPVGDPAEWQSIRNAVAGPLRNTVLPIGSIKGHVGHTEGASGIVSLIKVLMMMRGNYIPPQASFKSMNPNIHAQSSDNMEVVTSLRSWPGDRKVALLNNYGACGSNSSVVVAHSAHKSAKPFLPGSLPKLPFWISGLDVRSIAAYSAALAPYIRSHTASEDGRATLADLSFNMKWQSNPGLPQGLAFSCSSLGELQDKLAKAAAATKDTAYSVGILPVKPERPVVLCFGGQVSTFVGLDRAIYDGAAVLRHHLDECDAAITSHGLDSIYPGIFSCEPYQDVVKLQTALFAMQYASAKSWIDCGLSGKVVSLVGHSFGEITALCVAGVLSLDDTVKVIAGRAKLVQSSWGPDPGAMMAIEADEALVHQLLKKSNLESDGSAAIACYNGPRSFTVAGSTKAIDAFAATLTGKGSAIEGVKSKRLNVTNAFHSALVENIVDRLGEVGKGVTFHDAVIPIERATEHDDPTAPLDWTFVGSHMRQPVFFNHAVQRLAKKHPQAIFLEAGSNSTITVMASRALAQTAPTHSDTLHFQSMSITNTKKGIDRLTDATVDLWKQGLRVSFWPHHRVQKDEYAQLLLPPYQFEKSRHWLELKSPIDQAIKVAQKMMGGNGQLLAAEPTQQGQVDPKNLDMWTFIGFQDQKNGNNKKAKKLARFRINTLSHKYQRLFATHVIAKTAPIAPATLEIDIAIETLFSLSSEWRKNGFSPVVRDMLSHSPICADSTREFYIDLEPLNKTETEWYWTIHSVGASRGDDKHAEGRIDMCSPSDPAALKEFGRWERVVSHAQCQAVLASGPDDEGVEALQGRNVYRAFEEVVDFGSVYHGVRYVVGRDNGESAGVVHKRHTGDTWLDVPKADSYGQVAGMYVNLLTDIPASDMFVATGLELVMRSPKSQTVTDGHEHGPSVWHVLARHARQSEKSYVTDVFIFDASTGALAEVIMGLTYVRIPKATMSKILARVTVDKSFVRSTAVPLPSSTKSLITSDSSSDPKSAVVPVETHSKTKRTNIKKVKSASGLRDVANEVRDVVANVSGIEANEISLDSEMADLGIDSLMGMELAREIESSFHCTLDSTETMAATTLREFVACVSNALARAGGGINVEREDDEDDDDTASGDSDFVFADSWDEDTTSDISTLDGFPDLATKYQDSMTDSPLPATKVHDVGEVAAREAEALRLVAAYTTGWGSAELEAAANRIITTRTNSGSVIVVTGASGSLGSHIVQVLAERPDVATVVCINRVTSDMPADKRQAEAFSSRGINLSPAAREKLRVYGTDTSKPHLGLSDQEYAWLVQYGTHIIHNAWPMSATRPLKAFEPQLKVMRNLLDLAHGMATGNQPRRIGFQFISSIGVTGFSTDSNVLEQPMPMTAVMPSGYNEAKWVCERMLTETLRRHPRLFRAMVARPGQISGSTTTGFWNPVEHFAFVAKSAQAVKAFPDLQGVLHWLPVDKSANVMVDLLNIEGRDDATEAYPVYHVDNPVGQPWKELSPVLAAALDIPPLNIVPFQEWIKRVRQSSLTPADNPAALILGFLEGHFERMACGGIVLDTQRSREHSKTMATEGPVSAEVVRSYVSSWKSMSFLS
ncbi:beta-ketoacyl synthase domain-containing protein [Colletotrichum truncatum]|uniref:Beta-ketoacyl synthase domain-containing protein n=1 Tax=Colletotrichum truncatum TaxID=5467 RepID=A0ACC3YDS1_COLTU|nr:beta-ketoacyl synthase domain-containing protein [Colletotrichum truncatum]XP_036582380.1 beta-ketoacyl synthase domain-containing protein [Colletotrichum truncatum]KAF6790291.1 beta-ketoacyl synthase domain-containing protein [Colletotrichum truncatum]KAF6791084.1 beta-ketoacyl synthase domain-containing protein [Colletotrichum truncatum]